VDFVLIQRQGLAYWDCLKEEFHLTVEELLPFGKLNDSVGSPHTCLLNLGDSTAPKWGILFLM
jgi:hypothetical protein